MMDAAAAIIRADGANYFGAVQRRFAVQGLQMSETAYAPGTRIPSHQHEAPSFFMPLRGGFVEGCAGAVREYVAGDVSYHPSGEPHWLRTEGGAARGFAIEVGTEWRATLGATTRWDVIPRDLSFSHIAWTLGRLYHELHVHDSARPLAVAELGVTLSATLGAQLAATTAMPRTRRRPRWLDDVRALLHDAPSHTPTLAELSEVAGITPAGIIKAFQTHERCTPGAYLRQIRLARARRSLAHTARPISAIALDAGFYDHSHFVRVFRAVAGMTPTAYRSAVRARS